MTDQPFKLSNDLASRVVKKMVEQAYQVFKNNELNIVYLEGINANGTINNDAPDLWNDLRTIIQVVEGVSKFLGIWRATTEPGLYYTHRPLNDGGAARIAFGQYKAWQVGIHKDHEALVQTGGAVTVCRDGNRDGLRTNDPKETGYFGINQHWGGDSASVGRWSAGCLVAQSRDGHREFMKLVKSDSRYQQNSRYVFYSTILDGSKL